MFSKCSTIFKLGKFHNVNLSNMSLNFFQSYNKQESIQILLKQSNKKFLNSFNYLCLTFKIKLISTINVKF